MSTHTATRALGGTEGYRRLARLLVRAFYSGEVPPPEADAKDENAPQPTGRGSKLPKHTFPGLAVLLIDYLASPKVDGYADEASVAADLRLSQKNVRKALRYLEGEGLVAAESVKFAFKRRNAEEVDDPEVEERKRRETHVFWCIDFPRMVDSLRLRLHRTRETLRRQVEGAEAVQQYLCPMCGSQYSSLDAAALVDPFSGVFRCEIESCRQELVERTEGPTAGGASGASRRERQTFFRDLRTRFEDQLKPIIDQLEKLKEVAPPDYGLLQDWYQAKKEEAARRAKRLEAARRKVAAAGGAAAAELTDEQLLEWAERAQVVVALPGSKEAAGAAAVPGKELPAWFRGEEVASARVGAVGSGAGGAGAQGQEEQRQLLEQQYLEQYLAQVRAQQAAGAGAAEGDAKKRVRLEQGWAPAAGAAGEDGGGVKAEEVKEEEVKAEEMKAEGEGEEGGGIKWEGAEAEDVGAANGDGGDDELEWEDA